MGEPADYDKITEGPGSPATQEQLDRLYQRYDLARTHATGRVLEIACGHGLGLAFVGQEADLIVGTDRTESFLRQIRGRGASTALVTHDAERMPFRDAIFDFVFTFESIYYFPNPADFLDETARVLVPDGRLLVGSVNPEWSEFAPSPFSTRYFGLRELAGVAEAHGFGIEAAYGGFPTQTFGFRAALTAWLRRLVVRYAFIPGSLDARAKLKRVFYGRLEPLPESIKARKEPVAWAALRPEAADIPYKLFYILLRRLR